MTYGHVDKMFHVSYFQRSYRSVRKVPDLFPHGYSATTWLRLKVIVLSAEVILCTATRMQNLQNKLSNLYLDFVAFSRERKVALVMMEPRGLKGKRCVPFDRYVDCSEC